jgi:hypothetical protein
MEHHKTKVREEVSKMHVEFDTGVTALHHSHLSVKRMPNDEWEAEVVE